MIEFVEFTDADGKRTAIRKDLIAAIYENSDGSTTIAVSLPKNTNYGTYKNLTYGYCIDKLCSKKGEG